VFSEQQEIANFARRASFQQALLQVPALLVVCPAKVHDADCPHCPP
jgi:hypothetical protein